MIEVKVNNGVGNCKMGGDMPFLLIESIVAVRGIYEALSKDPVTQKIFLEALRSDEFLDDVNVKVVRDNSDITEDEAGDFLKKFMDALRR